jgi:VPDSG-CTERM motif
MRNFLSSRKELVFGPALAFALALGPSSATATTIVGTATFTSDHCTDGCLTNQTNGGTITVTDNGNGTLDFLVQLANGNQFINGGFEATFGFNLSGISAVTYSNLTSGWTIAGGTNPQPAATGNHLHMDGTGNFTFGVLAPGNPSNPAGSTLQFSITAIGLDITDFAANDQGQFLAADIISGTTGFTGAIDASVAPTPGQQSVPDGGTTVTLLGSALLGLGMLRRRFGPN